jgi:hypothetical protein
MLIILSLAHRVWFHERNTQGEAQTMERQYTYDCKLKKIREMLLTTLEHNQHDVIDVI